MLDLRDINYIPTIKEISGYIENPLFDRFLEFMNTEYKPLCRIEYSKDVWFRGWNIKLKKAGKGLCVIYPQEHQFMVLVVVGNKERPQVERLLPQLSKEIQEIYHSTKEGNGQRWLMVSLKNNDSVYQDILKLICIRRECR